MWTPSPIAMPGGSIASFALAENMSLPCGSTRPLVWLPAPEQERIRFATDKSRLRFRRLSRSTEHTGRGRAQARRPCTASASSVSALTPAHGRMQACLEILPGKGDPTAIPLRQTAPIQASKTRSAPVSAGKLLRGPVSRPVPRDIQARAMTAVFAQRLWWNSSRGWSDKEVRTGPMVDWAMLAARR
jgi:hypothetical protein